MLVAATTAAAPLIINTFLLFLDEFEPISKLFKKFIMILSVLLIHQIFIYVNLIYKVNYCI